MIDNNQRQHSTMIQEVIQREKHWAQAHLDLDLTVVENILSDDYKQRQPDGTFKDKADLLDSYRSGNRYWEIAESTDHNIQLAGSLAILIGRWRGKGNNNGESFDYSARFLSIYRLKNEEWKMILDVAAPEI